MTEQSHYLRPIRAGEFDMVNISLIGHDPNTGRSFEECHAEWRAEFDKLIEEGKALRWWQIARRWRWAGKVAAIRSHYGM